jgi:hypothetical protein
MPSLSNVDPRVSIVLHSFPLPIAHQVRHLQEVAAGNLRGQYEQLQEVVGFTIRYCTVVLLSQYTADAKVRQDTLDRHISDTIGDLSVEVCVTYIRGILEAYSQYADRLFIPEMLRLRYELNGELSENVDLLVRLAQYANERMDPRVVDADGFYLNQYEQAYRDWQQLVGELSELPPRAFGEHFEDGGALWAAADLAGQPAISKNARNGCTSTEFELTVREDGGWLT